MNQPIKPKLDSCTSHMATTNSDSSIDYETNKILENNLVFLKTSKDVNKRLLLNDHCLDELMKFYHNKQGHLGQDCIPYISEQILLAKHD